MLEFGALSSAFDRVTFRILMPYLPGIEVLGQLRCRSPSRTLVAITGAYVMAVEALKHWFYAATSPPLDGWFALDARHELCEGQRMLAMRLFAPQTALVASDVQLPPPGFGVRGLPYRLARR